ncbi:MAG: flagellar motor protein MotB [Kiloniellaceae bacterium]
MAGLARDTGRRQSNSHIVALLSLKILLLAFFILLNSMASFEEERRDAVVESVREAFQGLLPADRNVTERLSGLDGFDGSEDVISSLNELFGRNLPLAEKPDASGSRTLQVDLQVGELFTGQGSEFNPEGTEILRLVAGVLSDARFSGQDYQIDVLYGLSGRTSGVEGNHGAVMRSGALVRELEGHGLPPARLSAGLLPNFPGTVRLHFTVETAAAPGAAEAGGEN